MSLNRLALKSLCSQGFFDTTQESFLQSLLLEVIFAWACISRLRYAKGLVDAHPLKRIKVALTQTLLHQDVILHALNGNLAMSHLVVDKVAHLLRPLLKLFLHLDLSL